MNFLLLALVLCISLIFVASIVTLLVNSEQENFRMPDKAPNIILMGDYILSDADSLTVPSIKELLRNKFPLSKMKLLATECATIGDFNQQIGKIPSTWNSDNTYAFISVGNNDMFNNISNCDNVFEVQPIESKDRGKANKLSCLHIGEIYEDWKVKIDTFLERFNEVNTTILSSYYLPVGEGLETCGITLKTSKQLEDDVDIWNADLANYSKNKGCTFIALDKYFGEKDLQKGTNSLNRYGKVRLSQILERQIVDN